MIQCPNCKTKLTYDDPPVFNYFRIKKVVNQKYGGTVDWTALCPFCTYLFPKEMEDELWKFKRKSNFYKKLIHD